MESQALSIGEQFLMAFKEGEKVGLERRGLEVARLMAALAAAEAECARWRDDGGMLYDGRWVWIGDDDMPVPELTLPEADANDATRARLGLGKIGEVK